jgi:hypothetical protein
MWCGCLVAAAVLTPPALGQSEGDQAAGEAITAPTVDWSHGQRALRLVEDWVHAGHWGRNRPKPEQGQAPPLPTIKVRGLSGLKVTLRSGGQFAGAGAVYRQPLKPLVEGKGQAVDLVPLLSRAAEKALKQAHDAVLDARLKSLRQGINRDDSKRPTLKQVGRRLEVSVQLGKSFTPIEVKANQSISRAYAQFAPGYHGLRMITGSEASRGSFIWPANAIAGNDGPKSQLVQLLDGEGLKFTALKNIAKPNGPRLQRFDVIHVVRARPDLPVQRLQRGQVIMPAHAVSEATLQGLAQRLGQHLVGRFTSNNLVRGTFHPASGQYDPQVAEPRDQALACYALSRHVDWAMRGERHRPFLKAHARKALDTATRLGRAQLEAETIDPSVTALVILTLIDTPLGDADQALRDNLTSELQKLHAGEGKFLQPAGSGAPDNADAKKASGQSEQKQVKQGPGALIAAAMSTMYDQTRNRVLRPLAADAVDHSWQRLKRETKLAALPWVAMAHRRVVERLVDDQGNLPDRVTARQQGLAKLIDQFVPLQIIGKPPLGPSDVVGGFQLRPRPRGAPPSPDWRSAQVLMLLAVAMQDQRLVEKQDRLGWLLTGGLAARFLGQLMMDEPDCYFVASADQAAGGVRMAPWDNRLAVSASAMSLLAVTELRMTADQGRGLLPSGRRLKPAMPGQDGADDEAGESTPQGGRFRSEGEEDGGSDVDFGRPEDP